jgi:hypothetical protein
MLLFSSYEQTFSYKIISLLIKINIDYCVNQIKFLQIINENLNTVNVLSFPYP